jgi:hypothetical protein
MACVFWVSGFSHDINVLEWSSVFSHIIEGRAPLANYAINGYNYTIRYYLADGIYPQRLTIVKTISCPQGKKAKLFAAAQELACKKGCGTCIWSASSMIRNRSWTCTWLESLNAHLHYKSVHNNA